MGVTLTESNGTMNLAWTETGSATSWQVAYGASANVEDARVATVSTTSSYSFAAPSCGAINCWVRAYCDATDQSRWVGPFTHIVMSDSNYVMQSGVDTVRTCCLNVYDNGGPTGDYTSNFSSTLIILPETEDGILSIAGWLDAEGCCDYLSIYDGVGTSGTRLYYGHGAGIRGTQLPLGPFTSTTGGFTVTFTTDASVTYPGFELLVSCANSTAICREPQLAGVTNVTYQGATVNWTGQGEDYEVSLQQNGVWGAEVPVHGYSHTFTGLQPQTTYQFRVRQDCDTLGYSDWSTGTFTTDSLPCMAPNSLTASNITGSTADLSWAPVSTETQWEVRYAAQGDTASAIATATTLTLTDLFTNATYTAWVRALCGNGSVESDWSEPVEFTTLQCPLPGNVTVGQVAQTSAVITWTAPEGYSDFTLLYGNDPADQGMYRVVEARRLSPHISIGFTYKINKGLQQKPQTGDEEGEE